MSKVIPASCVSGVVTADEVPVAEASILSEGIGASVGLLVLDGERKTYLAKTSPDLKSALLDISGALDAIASALTAIGSQMLGPATAPPPTLPGFVSSIDSAKAQIDTLRGALK